MNTEWGRRAILPSVLDPGVVAALGNSGSLALGVLRIRELWNSTLGQMLVPSETAPYASLSSSERPEQERKDVADVATGMLTEHR